MIGQTLNIFFSYKKAYFTIAYFLTLLLDLWVKVNLDSFPYRYFSKTLLMVLLIIYYKKNHTSNHKKNHLYTLLALVLFWAASIAVIDHVNDVRFLIGMLLFIMAKVMYCLRFTNYRDFSIIRLLPFLAGSFVLMVFVFSLIYNKLGFFLVPVLIYFFISLILFLFSYLRKNDVNNKSYNVVIVAMVLLILSEVIMALKTYYTSLVFEDISVMLFYGIAQFLIVYGILIEVKVEDELQ